jgi:ribonuclease HI
MNDAPHYTLLSECGKFAEPGRWRFVLKMSGASEPVAVDDVEPEVRGERLELLAVVRGLEALDQPSRVTLITSSSYVRKGFRHGLGEWRRNGWQWEYYGEMVPVTNGDLWQRVDRAMRFHHVDCRSLRIDPPHRIPPPPGNRRLERHLDRGVDRRIAPKAALPRQDRNTWRFTCARRLHWTRFGNWWRGGMRILSSYWARTR